MILASSDTLTDLTAGTPHGEQLRFKEAVKAYNDTNNLTIIFLVSMLVTLFVTLLCLLVIGDQSYYQRSQTWDNLARFFGALTIAFLVCTLLSRLPARINPSKQKAKAQGRVYAQTIFRPEHWQVQEVNIDKGYVTARPIYPGDVELNNVVFFVNTKGVPYPLHKNDGISFQRIMQIAHAPWYVDAVRAASGAASLQQPTGPAVPLT